MDHVSYQNSQSVSAALSIEKKWPAQRDAFMAMYTWLLDQGVPASKIVFSGTSAGGEFVFWGLPSNINYTFVNGLSPSNDTVEGGLILLAMLYIRDHTNLPQPRCAIAHSPWTDAANRLTDSKHNPLLRTDYIDKYWSTGKIVCIKSSTLTDTLEYFHNSSTVFCGIHAD